MEKQLGHKMGVLVIKRKFYEASLGRKKLHRNW